MEKLGPIEVGPFAMGNIQTITIPVVDVEEVLLLSLGCHDIEPLFCGTQVIVLSHLSSVKHPAPFPEDIVTVPLLQTTDEGDLVLDPFMGTGTTGKVANRWGRRFIGYDLKDYGN